MKSFKSFIIENTLDISSLGLGDKVYHVKHGPGEVTKTTEKPEVYVKFTKGSTQRFSARNTHELEKI